MVLLEGIEALFHGVSRHTEKPTIAIKLGI